MSSKHAVCATLITILGLSTSACTGNGQHRVGTPAQSRTADIVVHNANPRDVNLYVMNGPQRVRIGTARSMTTSRFALPALYLAGAVGVVFQVDAIGGSVTYTFPPMHISIENKVEIQLGNVLAMSSFGIW